jgi:hypothetical protein
VPAGERYFELPVPPEVEPELPLAPLRCCRQSWRCLPLRLSQLALEPPAAELPEAEPELPPPAAPVLLPAVSAFEPPVVPVLLLEPAPAAPLPAAPLVPPAVPPAAPPAPPAAPALEPAPPELPPAPPAPPLWAQDAPAIVTIAAATAALRIFVIMISLLEVV